MSGPAGQPIDVSIGAEMLKEANQIMNQLGVVPFLRQGTCLGAVRDNELIPWDDDLDLGSVLGLDGLDEDKISRVAAAFRENGYYATIESSDHFIAVAMIKSSIRLDWNSYKIIDGSIFHYPGIRLPIRLFSPLKEIEFLGDKFHVPNPPEEYLSLKYGPSWTTPKKLGWVNDVVEMIPEGSSPGRAGKLRQFLDSVLWRRTGRLKVVDNSGDPVAGVDVVIVGLCRSKTNKQGYAKFYLPVSDFYALTITHGDYQEVLYEERMAPGSTYVHKLDPSAPIGRLGILSPE